MEYLTRNTIFHYLVLCILIYLVVFVKLGDFPMRWWDESMFAVNVYEMSEKNEFFSLYFDGKSDLFNTKPPLLVWLQLLFVKVIGYNELAIRLPSALAASACILVVFHYCKANFGYVMAWSSSMILLTSNLFIGFHGGRTGDSDTLLTLFMLLSVFSFLRYTRAEETKHIYFTAIFTSLAVITKLYAGLIFLPVYIIYIVVKHKVLFRTIHPYAAFLIIVIPGLLLVLFRDMNSPGYIEQILGRDLSRISSVIENNSEPLLYYVNILSQQYFSNWIVLMLIGVILAIINNNRSLKLIAMILGFNLLVLTLAPTKLYWYVMPVIPLLSMMAAYALHVFVHSLKAQEKGRQDKLKVIVIIIIFIIPYKNAFLRSQKNKLTAGEYKLEAKANFFHKRNHHKRNFDGLKIYHDDYKGALLFYTYKYRELNQSISIYNNVSNIHDDDLVLVSEDRLKNNILSVFECDSIDGEGNATLFRIIKKKADLGGDRLN